MRCSAIPWPGFYAIVINDDRVILKVDLSDIDMRQWHTYRIRWSEKLVQFFVDGQEVGKTEDSPQTDLGLAIWIDNWKLYRKDDSFQLKPVNLKDPQSLQIDWIEIQEI